MTTKSQKKVKAWAVVSKASKQIEYDAYFNGCQCCCAGEAIAVYDTKRTAEETLNYPENFHIVPVEITYTIPAPSKRKKM